MAWRLPLHTETVGPDSLWFVAVLGIAGLGAAALLGLALAAYLRRQSRSYFLIAAALVALLARSVVAGLNVAGVVSLETHHLLEHGLDIVMVALVVAAVYYARTVRREVRREA